MKCSVVILNWNGLDTLRQFLPSVLQHTQLPHVEIVVADNGSTDASVDYLLTQPVRLIQLDRNYGFAEGYNRAIQQVDAEYTVLLNSDVEVTPHWLSTMLTYMDAHPETLAAQPKVLSYRSKQLFEQGQVPAITFEHAGAAGGMMDILGYPYCRGRLMSHLEPDHGQYDDIAPIFWATGACMLVRTQVYKDLGGLDPLFFAHQEEIDFCWRIHTHYPSPIAHSPSGASCSAASCSSPSERPLNCSSPNERPLNTITCLPQATIYHVGGATLGYESPRKTFLNFRNNLLMLRKNLPACHRWWIMLVRFFLDYLAALQMLLTGQKLNAKAVFQARVEYHKMKKLYPLHSTPYTLHPTLYPLHPTLIARRSIVFDFYLLGKRN